MQCACLYLGGPFSIRILLLRTVPVTFSLVHSIKFVILKFSPRTFHRCSKMKIVQWNISLCHICRNIHWEKNQKIEMQIAEYYQRADGILHRKRMLVCFVLLIFFWINTCRKAHTNVRGKKYFYLQLQLNRCLKSLESINVMYRYARR